MAQILRSANRLAAFRPAGGCRCLATQSLPPLPYDYSALEPYISGEIMELHHKKHHQTYINAFNAALEQQAELDAKNDVAGLIKIQPILRFNGGGTSPPYFAQDPSRHVGDSFCAMPRKHASAPSADAGHVNHSLFWEILTPPKVRTVLSRGAMPGML